MKFDQTQLSQIKELGVSLIYLFGSFAEGNSLPLSDIDIGVLFYNQSIPRGNISLVYNQLYDIFTDVFKGKKIDIVILQNATLELRFDVISHGKIVYAAQAANRLDFEERTMLLYADFKPLLNEFNQAVLNRS